MPNHTIAQSISFSAQGIPSHEVRSDILGSLRITAHYKKRVDMFLCFAAALNDTVDNELFSCTPLTFFLRQLQGYEQVQVRDWKGKDRDDPEAEPELIVLDFYKNEDKPKILDLLPSFRKIRHPNGSFRYVLESVERLEQKLNQGDLDDPMPLLAGGAVPLSAIKELLEKMDSMGLLYMHLALSDMSDEEQEEAIRSIAEVTAASISPLDARLSPAEQALAAAKIAEILKKQREKRDT